MPNLPSKQDMYRVHKSVQLRPSSATLVLPSLRGLLQQLSLYCCRLACTPPLNIHLLIIILRFVYVVKLYNRFSPLCLLSNVTRMLHEHVPKAAAVIHTQIRL